MAQEFLDTRIVLRNDSTANWLANENQVLLKGEVGIEFLADGKAKMKIGDGTTPWSELSYFGGDDRQTHVFETKVEENETKDAAIERIVGDTAIVAGDIAIIKEAIADGKQSYTAYVYDGTKWAAMDGNYSATNVFTEKDITLTSALGNYAKNYTIEAGTALETLLSGLLQKEEEPGTPTKPSASISANGGTGETGSEYTVPTATLNVGSVGSYTYGPATGIVFNVGDVKLAEGADPAAATNYVTNDAVINSTGNKLTLQASGDKVKYTDASVSYTFSGTASYQAATTSPVTNLGNPSKTQTAIAAGSCTIADKTVSFKGWRRMFMGAIPKAAEINSETIKSVTQINEKASKDKKEFTAPVGTEKLIIAFPRSTSTSEPKVQYFTMSWEDFGDFALAAEKVKVADASGTILADSNTADEYMVYAYTPADPLKADTKFKVTLQ